MRYCLIAASLLLFIAAPSSRAVAESLLVNEFNFAALKGNTAALADEYLKEQAAGSPSFRNAKRIVPVYFSVIFQEDAKNFVKGRGLVGAAGGGEAKDSIWIARLKGLTPELRQKVTDLLFADFVADLAAQGFTVVKPEELAGLEIAKEIKADSDGRMKGEAQIRSTKDSNTFWHVVPAGMPFPDTGMFAQMSLMKNVSRMMVDGGKASALVASMVINVSKLTGIGTYDGSLSPNDNVFGLAVPTANAEFKPGISMQFIPYNGEYEKYGEKHTAVYNSQYGNGLSYSLTKPVETAAAPIGAGQLVNDNKDNAAAFAAKRVAALLGSSTKSTLTYEYEVAVDPVTYEETARKLGAAVRGLIVEKLKSRL